MAKQAQKRRKVWVVAWEAETYGVLHCSDTLYDAKQRVPGFRKDHPSTKISVSPFIESRPGDVVLSREDVQARKRMAEWLELWLKDMKMENDDEHDHIRHGCGEVGCVHPIKLAAALLRGGR